MSGLNRRGVLLLLVKVGIPALMLAGCSILNLNPPEIYPDPGSPPIEGALATGAQATPLSPPGWHLIGAPCVCRWGGTSEQSVTVTRYGQTKTLAAAVQSNWLYKVLWDYDSTLGDWIKPTVYDQPLLYPDEGYWIYTYKDALILNFPEEALFEEVRYLYSKTNQGFWQFVNYCWQNWKYEDDLKDEHGEFELVQGPPVTYHLMTGAEKTGYEQELRVKAEEQLVVLEDWQRIRREHPNALVLIPLPPDLAIS